MVALFYRVMRSNHSQSLVNMSDFEQKSKERKSEEERATRANRSQSLLNTV